MNIGERLKYFRKSKNVTQQTMAQGICSISYLSKIENGVISPSDEIIELLCQRLNTSVHELKDTSVKLKEMQSELDDLYVFIKKKKIEVLIYKFQELLSKYKELTGPQVLLTTTLFKLRISLLDNSRDQSKELYTQLKELEPYNSDWTKQYFYKFCGLYNYLFGSYEEALNLYKSAEMLTSDSNYIEEVYYQLSLTYSKLDQISLSTTYLSKALNLFFQKMDYEQCTNCYLLMGINYRKMKEYEKAKECYFNILNTEYNNKHNKIISKVYHNLGLIHSELGDSEKSISYYWESILIKENGISKLNTIALLVKEYIKIGDNENASCWLEKGMDLSTRLEVEEMKIKFTLIKYKVKDETVTESYKTFLEDIAIPYLKKKNDIGSLLKECINDLAVYYEHHNKYKTAYYIIKNFYT